MNPVAAPGAGAGVYLTMRKPPRGGPLGLSSWAWPSLPGASLGAACGSPGLILGAPEAGTDCRVGADGADDGVAASPSGAASASKNIPRPVSRAKSVATAETGTGISPQTPLNGAGKWAFSLPLSGL